MKLFQSSQARLEREYSAILTDETKWRRTRRLNSLRGMVDRELNALEKSAGQFSRSVIPAVYEAGAGAVPVSFAWTNFHREAVASLGDDLYRDVLASTEFMREDSKRWIQDVSRKLTAEGYIEGQTPQQLARRFAKLGPKALTASGLPAPVTAIKYADGSSRTLASYADMLFRTKTAVAYNAGTINVATNDLGVTRFEIRDGAGCGLSSHDDPETANGLIVDAETAAQYPISHPNCRRAFAPRPDLDGEALPKIVNPLQPGPEPLPVPVSLPAGRPARSTRSPRSGGRSGRSARASRAPRVFTPDDSDIGTTPALRAQVRRERALASGRAADDLSAARAADELAAIRAADEAALAAAEAEAKAVADAAAKLERSRKAEEARLKRSLADVEKINGATLDRYDITAEEFLTSRFQVEAIRKQIRADAKKLSADLDFNKSADRISAPPPRRRVVDNFTGRVSYIRDEAEYEFYDRLDVAELSQIKKWLKPRSAPGPRVGPDLLQQPYGAETIEDGIDAWLDEIRRIDGAKALSSGRTPNFIELDQIFRGESETLQNLIDEMGLALSDLWNTEGLNVADSLAEATGKFVVAEKEMIARRAAKEAADVADGGGQVFARLTTDPPVWELTAAEYADELSVYTDPTVKEFMDRIAAGAKPANDDEIFFLNRWRELVPAGFESDPEDIASMYDQIQYAAKSFGSVVDDVGDF